MQRLMNCLHNMSALSAKQKIFEQGLHSIELNHLIADENL
jgi:hypothetical protein